MSDTTARLALPMIVPGQAQKEMTHNEALTILDMAVQASVIACGVGTPPPAPVEGNCWIVGTAPSGEWAGHADAIASWTAGGWRFAAPTEGCRVWVTEEGLDARFKSGAWVLGVVNAAQLVVGGNAMLAEPVTAIPDPTGGTTVDLAARGAIAAILSALRHHNLVQTA
jgi:hypothetical protein